MKLFIVRDQAKGFFGGVKFEIKVRVELTEEESALIKKYNAEKEILLQKEIKIPFASQPGILNIDIKNLIEGLSFKCKDIGEILDFEKHIKEACQQVKEYLDAMKQFGGRGSN